MEEYNGWEDWEDAGEDVNSYRMTLRRRKDTGN
jgi:hypothetical protein